MKRAAKVALHSMLVGALTASFPTIRSRALDVGEEDVVAQNAQRMFQEGRQTFRYDTFGDEAFWGDTLKLHQAIEGSAFGGVGSGVSPAIALAVGLKVDADALPRQLVESVRAGVIDLNSPATTLSLLKLNAVIGVTGFFSSDGSLKSVGIQCALCHSTADNSFQAPGVAAGNIGRRLDGWANRDLHIGAIINLSPDLGAPAKVLGVDQAVLRRVLLSWGPGKFDAQVFLDGKAFRPDGASAATLIPPAYGLAGVNLHTSTGWGSVTYWNAFVANLEMHGKGRFFDSRLNNVIQFPVAAANGFGNVTTSPAEDRITPKLAALHAYQLAIPAPKQTRNAFNFPANRGEAIFNGKAQGARRNVRAATSRRCSPSQAGMLIYPRMSAPTLQADRSPDKIYRTAPLGGLVSHQKGGSYHDGRFGTLADVVNHYDRCMNLRLREEEKSDLVQYLLTL